ncbi:MAG: hypothetical protein M1827_002206 [Pycnora praestabilis]|nr:MAG: hypothetical protein M1827_002206 [Pycnora praestabilis]
MDVPEDRDIKVQRASADLLSDFGSSLAGFLWKGPGIRLGLEFPTSRRLEPFQELPQLLDPHLSTFLPPLISAFVTYLDSSNDRDHCRNPPMRDGTFPLPRAICKILYTFCKIRGEKVICRFLNNEPRYLDPLLAAFENWDNVQKPDPDKERFLDGPLSWEERYIILLWLSHQLLAPFDLVSISSEPVPKTDTACLGFTFPKDLPEIARRLIPISMKYLIAASKEREAAKALLVRLALRPDMRQFNLLQSLTEWSLYSFNFQEADPICHSVYQYIGILSFIAGVLVSADLNAIGPFISFIFKTTSRIAGEETRGYQYIRSSALARKIIIKIFRLICIIVLQPGVSGSQYVSEETLSTILEDVIDHLFGALADKDTPVRYAASKALSVIAAKLGPEMAAELTEAVIGSLGEDVLWEKQADGVTIQDYETDHASNVQLRRNLTAVNPLRWHGLTLTLAYLLLRASPFADQLSEILNALILALAFEQRSSTGSSLGTNVRDAANFGIWALSRRYSTEELLAVETSHIRAAHVLGGSMSVPEVLATELIVAASLDPSGNIRRGSSAALQELIGRHPDTVIEGIKVIQVVDYHAVALRSRALTEVAIDASRLGTDYSHALLQGLLEWRGVGSSDANSRRVAAAAIGLLSVTGSITGTNRTISLVRQGLLGLKARQVEERHGLLIALADIINAVEESAPRQTHDAISSNQKAVVASLDDAFDPWDAFQSVSTLTDVDLTSSVLRPELTSEAACLLISSLARWSVPSASRPAMYLLPSGGFLDTCLRILSLSLIRTEETVIKASSTAACDLFALLDPSLQVELVNSWISFLKLDQTSRMGGSGRGFGHLAALGLVFSLMPDAGVHQSADQETIIDALVYRCGPYVEIESKVAAIRSLAGGVLALKVLTPNITEALNSSLNDYTIDQRGDVGSLVRLEAIEAVVIAWKAETIKEPAIKEHLLSSVCRLAAEKLDKVRFRSWLCLQEIWGPSSDCKFFSMRFFDVSHTSSYEYYMQLLSLFHKQLVWVRVPLLEGYVTSAGVGSESLLRASRQALVDFADSLPDSGGACSLTDLSNDLMEVLERSFTSDRVTVPTLEVISFMFETRVFHRLGGGNLKWRNLFTLVQKAHYKSGNVVKLEAAIKVYTGLADIPSLHNDAVAKLTNMLLHPFPKVCPDPSFLTVKEGIES